MRCQVCHESGLDWCGPEEAGAFPTHKQSTGCKAWPPPVTSCFKEGDVKVGSLKEEDLHQDGEKGHREVLEHRGAERALLGTGGQDGWRGQAGKGRCPQHAEGQTPAVLGAEPQSAPVDSAASGEFLDLVAVTSSGSLSRMRPQLSPVQCLSLNA